MSNRPLTEAEIKDMLGVDDFADIPKEKVPLFVSNIHRMDKDVAIKVIEQFPVYVDLMKELTQQFFEFSSKTIEANNASAQVVMRAYERSLELMSILAQKEELSFSERQWFAEKTIELADRMAGLDRENKHFYREVLKICAWIVGWLASICLGILGLHYLNSKNEYD